MKRRVAWICAGAVLLGAAAYASSLLTEAVRDRAESRRQPAYQASEYAATARRQAEAGDPAAAEASYRQALRAGALPGTYLGELAVVQYRLKKYAEAEESYRQLIASGKDAAFVWNGIGNALRDRSAADTSRAGEFQAGAFEAYANARQLDPRYVSAWSNPVLLLESLGSVADAAALAATGAGITGDGALAALSARLNTVRR